MTSSSLKESNMGTASKRFSVGRIRLSAKRKMAGNCWPTLPSPASSIVSTTFGFRGRSQLFYPSGEGTEMQLSHRSHLITSCCWPWKYPWLTWKPDPVPTPRGFSKSSSCNTSIAGGLFSLHIFAPLFHFAPFLHLCMLGFADEFLDFGFPPPIRPNPGISTFQPTDRSPTFATCNLQLATCFRFLLLSTRICVMDLW